jgi:hypothetical protein
MIAFARSPGPNAARRHRYLSAGHEGAPSMAIPARHIMYSMYPAVLRAPQGSPSHASPSRYHAADLAQPHLNPPRAAVKSP